MISFKKYVESKITVINWNTQIHKNWLDQHTGKTHTYSLENRKLNTLSPHEQPSKYAINKTVMLMRQNALIPLIEIGMDGMIIDGHHRYYAAIAILGNDAWVPVEVHNLISENFIMQQSLVNGITYKAQEILNFVAKGDIQSISEWMNVSPQNLSFTYRLMPISLFIKQAEEMFGTYEEFPQDKRRTDKISRVIKNQPLYPVFVQEGDSHNFIMEGRHRIVAFWQAGIKQIPVFYVSKNYDERV